MDIYVIEMYDDQEVVREIMDKAFTSYKDASQCLLNKGYEVFTEEGDGWNLYFEKKIWHEKQWYIKTRIIANIIKLEVIK